MNRALATRLLVGVFVIEAIVPAVMIATAERHFAWSMYSRSSTKYKYVGETYSKQLVDLDPAEVESPWNAIHYGPRTLRLLCEGHAEVSSITRYHGKRLEKVERC